MLENKCPNCGRNLDTGLKCPVCSLRTKEIKTPSEMGAELGKKTADKLCDLIFENKKGVGMPKKIIFIGEFQRQKIRSLISGYMEQILILRSFLELIRSSSRVVKYIYMSI